MSPEHWQRVKHVLASALERPQEGRAAFLDEACAGEPALRAEVESLLAADAGSGVLDSRVPTLAEEPDAAPATRVSVGTRLGPYEILSFIGAGGMGEVYRARDTRLGREVAVKALHPAAGGDAERRFDDEARAASALNHPNIVTVYDVGVEGGLRYVVSELLEGATLRARLAEGPLCLDDCLRLGRQIAAALAAAHDQGIVHRDLKPENLFLTRDGRIKILDFGLAKRLWGNEALPSGSKRTLPGTVLGTVGYMAPEQVRGEPVDARADLFAFGALLYEMLAGRRAFSGGSAVETMTAILVDEPPAFAAPVSPALERVLLQCLRKDPGERLQSAQDVDSVLAAIQEAAAMDASARVVRPAPSPARRALAVLPFLNMTGDPELDYLCEGIAEELINALARIDGLRVAARSSSFRVRSDSITRIGALLGVDTVLEGSVRRMGKRLRVTARLVNAADGYPAWSERFDLDVEEILKVQDQVAARVVEALRLSLGPRRKPGRSGDPAAYRLYLKGLHFWSKRHQGGLEASLEAFRQSTERDPLYAPAWAGLADSYALLGHSPYDVLPPREALPKAKAAALKALELEPELAAPHATLGWIHLHYDWDWGAAESAFERALALDPERAATHHWYGFYLSAMGLSQQALQAAQRAWELDPLSLIVNAQLCQPQYYARRFDEVAAAAQQVLAMDPGFAVADYWLGSARAAQGRYHEAIAAFEALGEHGGGQTTALALIGNARARAGERETARGVLRELEALAAQRHVPAFHPALVHIGLGDADQAFACLERACDERIDALAFANVEPLLDPLRPDARFEALLRRIGLPAHAREDLPERTSPSRTRLSVAVLPFRELSADVESSHLALGLADATIAELARLHSLLVRPTSTILRYRESLTDALQAGRELGVDVVVDAGFERDGARLRVSVRILDTRDGEERWSGSLEGSLEDVFALQDEVARRIARALEPERTPAEDSRPAEPRLLGPSGEAYEAYLKGKACLFGETLSELVRAVDWFERARERAPEFALAWAGLAGAYARLAFTYQPEGDWYARASATCDRALALDPALPEARYVRAWLRWMPQSGFDHEGAIRDLVPVLKARPSLEEAYVLLGNILHHVGLFDEARDLYERAEALSPGHPRARSHVVMCLAAQGDHEEALRQATRVSPRTLYAFHDYLVALSQIHLGRLEAAEQTVGEMERRVPGELLAHPLRGLLAAQRGDHAEADRYVRLTEQNRKGYGHYHHARYDVACIQALLGRSEAALAWLGEAARDGYPCHPHFESDAFLASLREHPGFRQLVAELRERNAGHARLYAELSGQGFSRVVLAVLPFEDLAGDPDEEYFADGLTDELITQLGRLDPERLAVIGRGSAMRYKGALRDLAAAARELRADYLLEGSVRRSEARVRVNARLLRASDQTQSWAGAYDRDLTDVLDVQNELGREVAGEIGLRLASTPRAGATRTGDPGAYQAYLRGRYCWNKRTLEGARKAIAYFEEALALDPRLAVAHAGIADCHALLGDVGIAAVPPREAFALAEEATARALALDDSLPQAHVSLAHVRMHRFDWAGALRAFERALKLDPNDATGHHWHALCLAALGRHTQALAAIRAALALDPVSLAINTDLGVVLYYARRYDAAIDQYRKTLELDPGFLRAWTTLGSALSQAGRHEEALAALERAVAESPQPARRAALARSLARAGDLGAAKAVLAELLALPPGPQPSPYPLALVHAALGEIEPAFERLAAAEQESAPELVYLGVDPWLDPLRGDERFEPLARRLGLGG